MAYLHAQMSIKNYEAISLSLIDKFKYYNMASKEVQ
jgi:hypothetical protein